VPDVTSRWVAPLAILALTGCAAPALTYTEPTDGSRARVRFAANTDDITVLRGYDDSGCNRNEHEWMRLRKGSLISPAPKRLGMPLWEHHENAAKEVFVDASRSHTFLFVGSVSLGATVYRCGVPLTFDFAADRDYEVSYAQMLQNCIVNVSQIQSVNGAPTKALLKSFTNKVTDETRGCLEQFQKKRWQ
jgi:hypothetical protein